MDFVNFGEGEEGDVPLCITENRHEYPEPRHFCDVRLGAPIIRSTRFIFPMVPTVKTCAVQHVWDIQGRGLICIPRREETRKNGHIII